MKKLKSIIVLACFYNKVIKIWKEYLYNGNNGLLIPILKTNFESKFRNVCYVRMLRSYVTFVCYVRMLRKTSILLTLKNYFFVFLNLSLSILK